MAIISDGDTNVTLNKVDEKPSFGLTEASKLSASGAIKNQVSGERFKLKCKFRTSGTNLRLLLNMLKNGADYYYYTPEDNHSLYADLSFPLPCKISSPKYVWDNRDIYYGSYDVESVDYI